MNLLDEMERFLLEIKKNREIVSSKEYIKWIYDYVSDNECADSEGALYVYEGVDADNGQILGAFLDYVKELAAQQGIPIMSDDTCVFDNEQVTVKIKDKYFNVSRMYGQGSYTSVELLDKKPDYAFVKISY